MCEMKYSYKTHRGDNGIWEIHRSDGAVYSSGSVFPASEDWVRGATYVLNGSRIPFTPSSRPVYVVVKNGDYYGVRGPKGVSICRSKYSATERCRFLTNGLHGVSWIDSSEGWDEVE